MSNADRLRMAADAIDPCHGTGIVPCWSPGGPCPDGQSSCECCGPCRQVEQHATAALLRAIAHEAELFDGQRVTPQAVHWDSLMHLVAPALALANTILGEQT